MRYLTSSSALSVDFAFFSQTTRRTTNRTIPAIIHIIFARETGSVHVACHAGRINLRALFVALCAEEFFLFAVGNSACTVILLAGPVYAALAALFAAERTPKFPARTFEALRGGFIAFVTIFHSNFFRTFFVAPLAKVFIVETLRLVFAISGDYIAIPFAGSNASFSTFVLTTRAPVFVIYTFCAFLRESVTCFTT